MQEVRSLNLKISSIHYMDAILLDDPFDGVLLQAFFFLAPYCEAVAVLIRNCRIE